MTQDVSGFGAVITIVADTTFPAGIQITQFADDADPFDMASVQIADKAMGLNGDLIVWAKAQPLPVVINVIPGSDDDVNLNILAQANRVGQGKISAYDNITLSAIYPDGSSVVFNNGKITDGMFGKSIASAGRLKTRAYVFTFQGQTEAGI